MRVLLEADNPSPESGSTGNGLSEVLSEPRDTVMEPGNILWPICVTRDVTYRPSRLAGRDNVGEIGDSVGELSDGIMEFRGKVVRPELRDTTGKLTDMLGASDNKLDFGKSVDRFGFRIGHGQYLRVKGWL